MPSRGGAGIWGRGGRNAREGRRKYFVGQFWDTKCPKWALILMHGYASKANEDGGKRDFTQSRRKK